MDTETTLKSPPSREGVWRMFDRIAGRYDFLNRFLSLGQDVRWRRRMARHLPPGEHLRLLDLATGTADQILMLWQASGRLGSAIGLDLSEEMLARGREKVAARGLAGQVELRSGDATALPLPDASFEVVTISFGVRNLVDVPAALAEMKRVLVPGGRLLVLECSLPRSAGLRRLYLLYFRHVLPWIGGLISGDRQAYRYLNETVESFPQGEEFVALMRAAGFTAVVRDVLTLGTATIYRGEKPAAGERAV